MTTPHPQVSVLNHFLYMFLIQVENVAMLTLNSKLQLKPRKNMKKKEKYLKYFLNEKEWLLKLFF